MKTSNKGLAKEFPRWVSVDTPPEGNDGRYLTVEKSSYGYPGRISISHWWNGQWGVQNDPTHWMELPKHPADHDIPDDESGEAYIRWTETQSSPNVSKNSVDNGDG